MYIIITDFTEDIFGGAELNDKVLAQILPATLIKCSDITEEYLNKNINKNFIVSNFAFLTQKNKDFLIKRCNYIIYEHDHKYILSRNPGDFNNFLCPKEQIINYEFYKSAKKIFCQSSFHKKILTNNLHLDNIENLSGNLWSDKDLSDIFEFNKNSKENRFSILDSKNPIKNSLEAIEYCRRKKYKYELISGRNLLENLSFNSHYIFIPKSPETLSRICVEAKMVGCKVLTNSAVGAIYEDWFNNLSSLEIIEHMKNKKIEIKNMVENAF